MFGRGNQDREVDQVNTDKERRGHKVSLEEKAGAGSRSAFAVEGVRTLEIRQRLLVEKEASRRWLDEMKLEGRSAVAAGLQLRTLCCSVHGPPDSPSCTGGAGVSPAAVRSGPVVQSSAHAQVVQCLLQLTPAGFAVPCCVLNLSTYLPT